MTVYEESIDGGSIGEQITKVGNQWNSVMYELVKLCASFEQSNEWVFARLPTPAHWIGMNLDVELSTAREWIRVGHALEALPLTDDAFRTRRLSYSKVRSLTRIARAQNEADLLEIAYTVPAARFKRALATWLLANEDDDETNKRHQRDRGVYVTIEPDGSALWIVKLPPLDAGKSQAALHADLMNHRRSDASAGASTLAQQRADALVRLLTKGSGKVDTEVIIHVRADGCTLDDGSPLANSVVERVASASLIRALIHDADGRPINASSRRRHPVARQKRVIKERDRRCVDCGSEDFLQYDHDPDFEISEHTVVDELFLRCSRCHARRHKGNAA